MKSIEGKIEKDILNIFDRAELSRLAKESKFIQRSTSRLEGFDFVFLLAITCMLEPNITLEGLCDCLTEINPEAEMKPQSLSDRINSEYSAAFMEKVLELALEKNLEHVRKGKAAEALNGFNRVFLQDSTQIKLSEKLSEIFKGSGGSASKSILKIDLLYELHSDELENILITDCKEPDQSLAATALSHLRRGDLIIRDLGYFALSRLKEIVDAEADYLSRLFSSLQLYLPDFSADVIEDLGEFFMRKFPGESVIETEALLGRDEKFPARLVGYKLPDKVVNERIRKARKAAAKKGRSLTKKTINWLRFAFYITSVDEKIWPAEVVGTIYRIRWRVELIFKTWKSLLGIDLLKGARPERITCFVYGRLIAIAAMTSLYAYAAWYAFWEYGREASGHKFFNWLKRRERIKKALFSGILELMFDEIKRDVLKNCKQQRKRKTSLELIDQMVPFMDSFESQESNSEKAECLA